VLLNYGVQPQNPKDSYIKSSNQKKFVITLIAGPSASGKTTLLYKFKLGEVVSTIPTLGCNQEYINYKNICFSMLDTAGTDFFKGFQKYTSQKLFAQVQAVIIVLDSATKEWDETKQFCSVLAETITSHKDKKVPVLLLANKQDLALALSVSAISANLSVYSWNSIPWHITAVSVVTGDGIYEGLDWLINTMKKS